MLHKEHIVSTVSEKKVSEPFLNFLKHRLWICWKVTWMSWLL